MPNNKPGRKSRVEQVIDAYHRAGEETDVLGSYTGIPLEARMMIDPADPAGTRYRPLTDQQRRDAKPVQDADDL